MEPKILKPEWVFDPNAPGNISEPPPKIPRQRDCLVCRSEQFEPLNKTVDCSGLEMALHKNGMLRVRYYETGDDDVDEMKSQDIVNINYCLICGRKLRGKGSK